MKMTTEIKKMLEMDRVFKMKMKPENQISSLRLEILSELFLI